MYYSKYVSNILLAIITGLVELLLLKVHALLIPVFRTLMYPKFEYRTITNLVYAKKHNVYFALGKDFSLKVLLQYILFAVKSVQTFKTKQMSVFYMLEL